MPFVVHSPDDPGDINQVELFLLAAMFGLVVENCINALAMLYTRKNIGPPKRKWGEHFVPLLLLINNGANITYNLTSLFIFYDEVTCAPMARVCNVSSHLVFLSTDTYILFCAYTISNRHVWVRNISVIIVLHRLGWAVYDIYESYGSFNEDIPFCEYIQNPMSAYYSTGDIVSDCFATLVIVIVAVVRLGGTSNISLGLIQRNLLRSLIIVGTSILAVYAGVNWVNQFWLGCSYAFQSYVLARAVNFDLMYDESLGERLEKKSMLESLMLKAGKLPSHGSLNATVSRRKRGKNTTFPGRPEGIERHRTLL
ncbi:hypothetical protein HDU77_011095 [Chytriomyces hyalinus]|nr:hypothetical protein HDU77_011095 [Chytriomyces hyalinus]